MTKFDDMKLSRKLNIKNKLSTKLFSVFVRMHKWNEQRNQNVSVKLNEKLMKISRNNNCSQQYFEIVHILFHCKKPF